jgi:hypothetical protein
MALYGPPFKPDLVTFRIPHAHIASSCQSLIQSLKRAMAFNVRMAGHSMKLSPMVQPQVPYKTTPPAVSLFFPILIPHSLSNCADPSANHRIYLPRHQDLSALLTSHDLLSQTQIGNFHPPLLIPLSSPNSRHSTSAFHKDVS